MYINGYIARKVMRKVGNCVECRNNLFSVGPVENCEVITARAYTPTSLRYPNTCFSRVCGTASNCISKNLPLICHLVHVKNILTTLILMEIDTNVFVHAKTMIYVNLY